MLGPEDFGNTQDSEDDVTPRIEYYLSHNSKFQQDHSEIDHIRATPKEIDFITVSKNAEKESHENHLDSKSEDS